MREKISPKLTTIFRNPYTDTIIVSSSPYISIIRKKSPWNFLKKLLWFPFLITTIRKFLEFLIPVSLIRTLVFPSLEIRSTVNRNSFFFIFLIGLVKWIFGTVILYYFSKSYWYKDIFLTYFIVCIHFQVGVATICINVSCVCVLFFLSWCRWKDWLLGCWW